MPTNKLGEKGFLKILRDRSPVYFKIRRIASSLPQSETEEYIISHHKQEVFTSKLIFGLVTTNVVDTKVDVARIVKFPKDQVPNDEQELQVVVLDKQYYDLIWELFDDVDHVLRDYFTRPDFKTVITH